MVASATLYGGPANGKNYAIEPHVGEVIMKVMLPNTDEETSEEIPVVIRTIKYSRVGKTNDFEYDGYLPEDDARSI